MSGRIFRNTHSLALFLPKQNEEVSLSIPYHDDENRESIFWYPTVTVGYGPNKQETVWDIKTTSASTRQEQRTNTHTNTRKNRKRERDVAFF